MVEEYVSKLQEDLRKRLNRLCWMHNEPALHVAEHFAELRNQVDYDAEKQIEMLREKGKEEEIVTINGKRIEFIRILDELEKRTCRQSKPQKSASDVYVSLEQRVEAFKDSSSSLDDLEDSYLQLAQEINDETDRAEKRLFGEQTIIYWPHWHESELGSLVYFDDVFLSKLDIDNLLSENFPNRACTRSFQSPLSQLLMPYKINKSSQVVKSLSVTTFARFAKASKFYYIGKTETEYSGYAAEGSTTIDKEFVSYQRKDTELLQIPEDACLDTSANLFDVCSSTRCKLKINNRRLESLHVNLLPLNVTRLSTLCLSGVHLDSFDTRLLSQLINLTQLNIQATAYSKDVKFDLEFLRPMRKLKVLELTLPGSSSWDFSVFKETAELEYLTLEGSSYFYAEKLPRLARTALEQILSPPELKSLKLSCFDIETIDRDVFNDCRRLNALELTRDRIGNSCVDAGTSIGFPLCFMNSNEIQNEKAELPPHLANFFVYFYFKLTHSSIRVLNATSFIGMKCLQHLSLTGNLIVDLPCGLFQDLPALQQLDLDKNLIRYIKSGVFGKLDALKTLKLDGNPIESIEANAFAQLNYLAELSLNGCRLKSIDSEMFNGLKRLQGLELNDNLIERIEVVAEDGRRRINVAKAYLSNEERELIEKRLFKDLSCLSKLYLKNNKLEKLDLNCFSNLKGVEHLYLSSNLINELSGLAGPELLCHMSEFDLNDNQLSTIDESALPKRIQELNFAKNHLKRLDEDFFAKFTLLQSVNFSGNELTWTITQATFASCRFSLCSIDVSLNESIRVTEDAFSNLPVLSHFQGDMSDHFASLLDFETLRIPKLTPEIVRALKEFSRHQHYQLTQPFACYLFCCSIKTLTWKSELDETPADLEHFNLSWLPNSSELEELDFSGNLIETLDDPDLFVDFEHVEKINLSHNQLSRIYRDIFKCQFYLQNVDLSGNSFASIDMGLFRHLTSLWHLNLSSNNISILNLARLFRTCPRLESLNIADNQLDQRSIAEPIDASSSYNLRTLVLANNRLEKMDFVRDMTSLTYLDLRGNLIESVMSNGGENLLGRLRELTHLDLSENKISRLTDEMFAHLRGQLEYFDVSHNSLDLNELI